MAASGLARRFDVGGLLPGDRPDPGIRQVPYGVFRRPAGDAGPLRQRSRPHRRIRHPLREDGSAGGADLHGHGHRKARARLDRFDHLFRAVRCRAAFCDPRPHVGRAGGLERRHLAERRRGAQHGQGRPSRTRFPLRPGRRIHGSGARSLGRLGRRLDHHGQEERPLCRPGQGEAARPQGRILQVARAVHRAALEPGPSGRHSGRRLRTRPALCRAMGRGDFYRRAQCRRGQGGLRRRQERGRQGGARSRPDVPLQPHHAGLRRHQGRGRRQDGA